MTVILEPLALETRARRQIRNVQRQEQDPIRLREAIRMHTESHRSLRPRSATGLYNCYGLLFASRRTWIDISEDVDGEVRKILQDDSYTRLPAQRAPEVGDIVLYKDHTGSLTHAAIVIKVPLALSEEIQVLSQWGSDGEYFHGLTNVIQTYGQPSEYWTDRREL